jgi:alkylation response protein AidB-like acyl-CoA dehydrogenase
VDGDRADEVAVVAGTDGDAAVFVVPRADVRATRVRTFDQSLHVADVILDGVRVGPRRVLLRGGRAGVERARHEAVTGMAAMMVGASRRMLELALGHVRERQQFGVPIGSFQAVKHMAVDVHVAIERARVLYQFAALTIAEDDARRGLAASMAKAAAGDAQRLAGLHCVQLFGGLGFTWENDLHLYLRRAKAGELLFGTGADHYGSVGRTVLSDAGGEVR